MLYISGQESGGVVTQKEYENSLSARRIQVGRETYPPRDGKARDSGIQYNITGQSLAADGGVSDQRRRYGRYVGGQAAPARPRTARNLLELVVDHDRIFYFVNGKVAILGTNANTTKGKILCQCEGSRGIFRRMKIAMLK